MGIEKPPSTPPYHVYYQAWSHWWWKTLERGSALNPGNYAKPNAMGYIQRTHYFPGMHYCLLSFPLSLLIPWHLSRLWFSLLWDRAAGLSKRTMTKQTSSSANPGCSILPVRIESISTCSYATYQAHRWAKLYHNIPFRLQSGNLSPSFNLSLQFITQPDFGERLGLQSETLAKYMRSSS